MQAYSLLEMPAQLALLHMNASPAAPRLCPAQLAAAKEAAAASAAVAEEQLRRIYGMPRLDLSSGDTVLQLLGEPDSRFLWKRCLPGMWRMLQRGAHAELWAAPACSMIWFLGLRSLLPAACHAIASGSLRMPVPERDGRRRGPPTVTLDHLQQVSNHHDCCHG